MKWLKFCVVIISAMVLVGTAWAGRDKQEESRLHLELDLVDGSRIIGTPGIESVPVQTSYARMDVALKRILTIEIAEDHENASINFRNGDKIKGVISLEPIKLETVLGTVKIGIEHIRKLEVVLSDVGLPGTLAQGLVLQYSFEKDLGDKVIDESGRGNHGIVHGAKWERLGDGGVYDFHGSFPKGGYIEVPDSSSLVSMEKTRQLTLALWIKPRTIESDFTDLICKGGNQPPDAHGGYELILNGDVNNELIFVSGDFARSTSVSDGKWVHGHMNKWVHIASTVDALTGKAVFYVNGKPTNDVEAPAGSESSYKGIKFDLRNNLYIGRADPKHHSNRRHFDGTIGEVRVYDRTLSPEDVRRLYDIGAGKYVVKTASKK